jgi:hypothetical protein
MTCKVLLMLVVLMASAPGVSAQEPGDFGAGKLEVGGFPGGGLWFVGGDDNTEVDFNNYDFGGGATWYFSPVVAVEAEAAFGLGISQNVNYQNREVHRIQMPHTLSTGGNIVIFPAGSAKRVSGYVTGGVGTMTLYSRTASALVFGLTEHETFFTTNVGGGVKIFRRGDAANWGFRIDYRILLVNDNSDAAALFAQSKGRTGHRFYIGMLYTLRR